MERENATAGTGKKTDSGARRTSGRKTASDSAHRSSAKSTGRQTKASAVRKKSKKGSGKKRTAVNVPKINIPGKYIAGAAVLIVLIIVIAFIVKGCGVSHKTPESVVRTLVESYVSGNQRKIRNCYGVKTADDALQQEVDATIKYLEAHNPSGVTINDCNSIYTDGSYTYMYVVYTLDMESGDGYPCISTYMTKKDDSGNYYVLTVSEITDEMSKQAATKYADFMKTDAYKDYVTAYEKFIKKNPGYEDKIAAKLK